MKWTAPENWQKVTAIDAHTGGEPLRIFIDGHPALKGDTILEKRRYAREELDKLRTATLWEPRGHADMYGCIITEPVTKDGDCGLIFTHNEGYSSMCGHGIIAVTKVGLETGIIAGGKNKEQIKFDTPAGRVTAYPHWKDDQVKEVSFYNVPSFVYALDLTVEVPGQGKIEYDLAFGGAFYAFVRAESADIELSPAGFRRLIELGTSIKKAAMNSHPVKHPFEEDLSFLYGVIFVGQAKNPQNHSRNVCVFADGEVDRCPTGTGVSARTALHHARGELKPGEGITIESIIGSCFKAEISEVTKFGPFDAVIPKVTGSAHICGINTLLLDPDDPLGSGFILR